MLWLFTRLIWKFPSRHFAASVKIVLNVKFLAHFYLRHHKLKQRKYTAPWNCQMSLSSGYHLWIFWGSLWTSNALTGNSNSYKEVSWVILSASKTDWTKWLLCFCIIAFQIGKFTLKNNNTLWNISRALIPFDSIIKVPNKHKFCVCFLPA